MKSLVDKKLQAIKMRESGYTQSEIASSLQVAKGSVSTWVRGVPVPENYYEKLPSYGKKRKKIIIGKFTYLSCSKCKQSKRIELFSKRPQKPHQYNPYCKECMNRSTNQSHINLHRKVIDYLGGKCKCGCSIKSLLEIHHTNNNGAEERAKKCQFILRRDILRLPLDQANKQYKILCNVCHEAEHTMIKNPEIRYDIKSIIVKKELEGEYLSGRKGIVQSDVL
jgi:predicted transcriptional regulator